MQQKKIRATLLFFVFLVVYLVIIANLFYLQVMQRSFFTTLGKQQYAVTVAVQPPRAVIYDCVNKPVAVNAECLSAFILPQQLEHPERVQSFLQRYFPLAYDRWRQNKHKYFMFIKRRLKPQELAVIKARGGDDIKIVAEPCRYYPVEAMGTIVGLTDIDNHGLLGVELLFDQQLGGTPSICRLERDARSGHFYFNKITDIQGREGAPVYLTIDSSLQFLAYQELCDAVQNFHAKEGGVIIVDPMTGEIKVSVSWPNFNPNEADHLNQEHAKNYPFTQCYEVGSAIKTFSAIAALEDGVVKPDELIDCEGKESAIVEGMKINTVVESIRGIIPFSEVIEKSNNIGTAKVAMRLGAKLYDYYMRFGFTQKTAVHFPGEQAGFITPPGRWSKRSIISLSFGYEIRTTIAQLAQAFCLIAQHGRPVKLSLIKLTTNSGQAAAVFSARTMDQIKDILTKTVLEGTARRARIKGYRVMGKTGTANTIENGRYNKHKNLFTFSGIVEKDGYQRVIVVYLKEIESVHQQHASTVAVPLFEQVAEKMLIHDKII
jgi:cell division protein FtsI (penicillin-binding protein 3)